MSEDEFQGLHNLVAPRGARRPIKRVGRGPGSGTGKTSGRGHKGQKARKSGGTRPGFEGGTLPLARRLPKRGFKNPFSKSFTVINVGLLAERFMGQTIDPELLVGAGLLHLKAQVKVLAEGDVTGALTLKVHRISAAARSKIEAAGGSVEIIPEAHKPFRRSTTK